MDTLTHVRRLNRFLRSQERKALRRKMDGYNSLASARRGAVDDKQSPDTLADTTFNLQNAMSNHTYDRDSRTRAITLSQVRSGKPEDVICHEVREMWVKKLGISADIQREYSLDRLAKWIVTQWCDVEGYDPVKHVNKIPNEVLRNGPF